MSNLVYLARAQKKEEIGFEIRPNPAGGPQHQKDAVLTIDMAKNPRQTAI